MERLPHCETPGALRRSSCSASRSPRHRRTNRQAEKDRRGLALGRTWKMNTLKLSLIGAVIIAAVAAPWFIQHQAQAKLRGENESLRTKVQQIATLTRENDHLSNLVAQGERAQAEMAK